MFYITESYVLDKDEVQITKIMMDLQPYEKTIQFEDGIEIDITARAFCDKNILMAKDTQRLPEDLPEIEYQPQQGEINGGILP